MKRLIVALLAAAISVGLIAGASAGKPAPKQKNLSAELRESVTVKGIFKHLRKLNQIANENGGNRAANTPGYDASADYVARKLRNYGFEVQRQSFDFIDFTQEAPSVFERTAPTPTVYEEDTEFSTMEYSGSGDVTAELVAVDLTLPPTPEPSSTSGCEASDFTGLVMTGKIALMQRGSCDFVDKVKNAEAAGAVGSVIFNEGQTGRTDVVFGTLGEPVDIPAVDTSFAIGDELADDTENGPTGTTVHIQTTTSFEDVTTENVLAETKKGDADNVVMAGAHLDSVDEGPGINDNGSGSATLIELARQMDKAKVKPKNKIRFAWWGAEEAGLVGSTEYVARLTEEEGLAIALYLNFDMIGSPNYARLIQDGNGSKFGLVGPDGSGAIERTFERYFESQGLASGQTAFDGRSDYLPFIDVGIPAGGLFTGAEEVKTEAQQAVYGGTEGEAFDPCYHQDCDDIENVSRRGLGEMSDAVVHSVARYSAKLKFIPRPGGARKAKAAKTEASEAEYLGSHLSK